GSDLAEIHQRYRMDGTQVVADASPVGQLDPRVTGPELQHGGPNRSGVGDDPPQEPAEQPAASRKRAEPLPHVIDALTRGIAHLPRQPPCPTLAARRPRPLWPGITK